MNRYGVFNTVKVFFTRQSNAFKIAPPVAIMGGGLSVVATTWVFMTNAMKSVSKPTGAEEDNKELECKDKQLDELEPKPEKEHPFPTYEEIRRRYLKKISTQNPALDDESDPEFKRITPSER